MALNIIKIIQKSFLLSLAISLTSISTSALSQTTLVHNVKGYTYLNNGQLAEFSAIVFEDGKVITTGANLQKNYPDALVIDGKGKTLLPGLIDGHGHYLGLGFNLLQVDVRDIASKQKTAFKVAQYAKANPELNWIKGRGWNQVLWPSKEFPTAKDLDEYVADKPVVLGRVDGHAVWLNSKAMSLAGITRNTISPDGGEIVKDKTGEPTGILIDNAENLLWENVPKQTDAERLAAFNKVNQHLLGLGITSVHDAGIDHNTYHFLQDQIKAENFKVRVYAMLAATDDKLEEMLKHGYISDDNELLSIRSVKIYGDGALGSRGAAMLSAYHDDPKNTGLLLTKPDRLRELYKIIFNYDFQINIHAIGDRANKIALDEFEFAFKNKASSKNLRNRIEHAQVIQLEDIPRFKALDILPSMQPTHATSDKNMAQDRIGAQRLKGAYAWQTFLKQGSKVIAGSDFPVELANPFFGLHAAVTRQDRKNLPEQGWIKEESLTIEQAFKAFTLDAAYGAHQDKTLGGLEQGKWADFILIDQDIFTIEAKDIWKTKVLETWVAGKKQHSL
ncbi:amidohydrolase [Psychrosphaera saromensis]|uniref:Amidohydrolase n=1 Tax=Psychrosphaera saromensis TaxID=716813 RepID=A0A2S7UTF5_9GAMM|nr:amidohydrolase [Psychrosphaera saromensis]PQJ53254.1 amidohydrolase [Psychrosphaera saromensis]GHB66836.1 amidohydrolase [Psychrosphaera saromensis]GLQ14980.1 amidohydrolase [Psychrosphaera saromensis]